MVREISQRTRALSVPRERERERSFLCFRIGFGYFVCLWERHPVFPLALWCGGRERVLVWWGSLARSPRRRVACAAERCAELRLSDISMGFVHTSDKIQGNSLFFFIRKREEKTPEERAAESRPFFSQSAVAKRRKAAAAYIILSHRCDLPFSQSDNMDPVAFFFFSPQNV